jgi:predicted DNA-binding helix-hairpin-helix protein
VPGIGPGAARALVRLRASCAIRASRDLGRIGIDVVRAGYFLTLHGRRMAAAPAPVQLRLFPHGRHLTQAPFRTPVPPCAYR